MEIFRFSKARLDYQPLVFLENSPATLPLIFPLLDFSTALLASIQLTFNQLEVGPSTLQQLFVGSLFHHLSDATTVELGRLGCAAGMNVYTFLLYIQQMNRDVYMYICILLVYVGSPQERKNWCCSPDQPLSSGLSTFDHTDLVAVFHGAKAVGDDHHRHATCTGQGWWDEISMRFPWQFQWTFSGVNNRDGIPGETLGNPISRETNLDLFTSLQSDRVPKQADNSILIVINFDAIQIMLALEKSLIVSLFRCLELGSPHEPCLMVFPNNKGILGMAHSDTNPFPSSIGSVPYIVGGLNVHFRWFNSN